jgi:hypothetical protein
VLLITGSWFVVRAVQAAHRDDCRQCRATSCSASCAAAASWWSRCFEYAAKFGAGINLSTNTFYMFYISLTFFHFMHVILGMVILPSLWVQARQGAYGQPGRERPGERRGLLAHGRPVVDRPFPPRLCDALIMDMLKNPAHRAWLVLMVATATKSRSSNTPGRTACRC